MNLEAKINAAIKDAMISKNKVRLDALRSIRARIIEYAKSGTDKAMDEQDEIKLLNLEAKKRRDAITMYEQANRAELAETEKAELDIIMEFLPAQMTEDEVKAYISDLIAKVGATSSKDMGKVMGPAMKELSGKADGKVVQTLVKDLLSALEG